MRKRRLAISLSGGFVLGVIACGEVLGEDDPLADAGTGDALAESQSNEAGTDGGGDDSSAMDAPTCDVNLLQDDPTNCGACGHICETAICDAGGCFPSLIVNNFPIKNTPIQILLRDGQLYVADNNSAGAGSGVLRCAEPAETQKCDAGRLFLRPDLTEVTFVDAAITYTAPHNGTFESYDGGVGTFPLDAAGVDAMAKDQRIISANSVAVFGTTVLVATLEGLKQCSGTCANLTPVPGTVVNTKAGWVVADANGFCYSGAQNNVRGVYCAPSIGQTPDLRATVVDAANLPRLALVGDDVVWADKGKIGSRKRSGNLAEASMALGDTVDAIDPIIANEAFVTWAHHSYIYRCPRSGCVGDPAILAWATVPQKFYALAELGKWLYFGEAGPTDGGRVLRIPK